MFTHAFESFKIERPVQLQHIWLVYQKFKQKGNCSKNVLDHRETAGVIFIWKLNYLQKIEFLK